MSRPTRGPLRFSDIDARPAMEPEVRRAMLARIASLTAPAAMRQAGPRDGGAPT